MPTFPPAADTLEALLGVLQMSNINPSMFPEIENAISVARSALAGTMDKPLPIHEAPGDGTHVLGFCPEEEPQWVAVYFAADLNCWLHVEELVRDVVGEAKPTHFLPLPRNP